MAKEVTLRGLNMAYAKELLSSSTFWFGAIFYVIGVVLLLLINIFYGAIIMFISALIMLNADWNGRNKVVKRLQWKR